MKTTLNHLINQILCHLSLAFATLLLAGATTMAQSTDRDNPAPLPASEIADDFHQNDPELFYQFVAGPGTVNFTLDLRARNYGGAFYVTLFDSHNHELAALDSVVLKGQTTRVTRRLELVKAMPVLMRLYSGNGQGSYRLRLDGPLSLGQNTENTPGVASAPVTDGTSAGGAGQPASPSAPSTDRDHPTPLDSSDLADDFHQDDPEYFYGFVVGPGTLSFRLDLKARNYGGAFYVTLFNQQGRELAALDGVVLKGDSLRVVKQVHFAKETPVIMRLYSGNGQGTYHLHIDGSATQPVGILAPPPDSPPDGAQPATTSTDSTNSSSAQAAPSHLTVGSARALIFGHAAAGRVIFRPRLPR